eukprot:gnl/TRDRNA2_/TRDRNA2_81431_c0_seq2.p1 gnl/TRDRNA2_/TRDRNA2_81431_c0~~gnl/TRDRNA2_/TRDRNA2_81431_c0_seq2.p1  ORF type:complete len:350 (+),score=108.08 gnl/TRDRNA2_/TRDRNA2_81431_c0_seq2:145-1050(+)
MASAGRVVNKTGSKTVAAKVEKHSPQKANKTVATAALAKPVVQATALATSHESEMADLKHFAQEMAKEEKEKWPKVHEKWSFDDKSMSALSLKVPVKTPAAVPNFLAQTAADCQCHFKNYCTCEAAIEFMDCIEKACTAKTCDCHQHQYKHACLMMADTCSSLNMKCEVLENSTQKATCIDSIDAKSLPELKDEPKLEDMSTADILKELKALKEDNCEHYFNHKNGWVNADEQGKIVQEKIDRRIKILEKRNSKIPDMHCYHDFKEYEYPEGKPPKAMASRQASSLIALVGAAASFAARIA